MRKSFLNKLAVLVVMVFFAIAGAHAQGGSGNPKIDRVTVKKNKKKKQLNFPRKERTRHLSKSSRKKLQSRDFIERRKTYGLLTAKEKKVVQKNNDLISNTSKIIRKKQRKQEKKARKEEKRLKKYHSSLQSPDVKKRMKKHLRKTKKHIKHRQHKRNKRN